ncbi:LysR family transcriptional regulator [Phytobacter sp. V91]|uniref:LysR family transcriptional regulator n=1 Tax=Phytobacter sp. V91 TaxID=3369425 RepID=UPI003F5F17AA
MQLRALKYFSQVAKSSSFRDAAEKLFVAPGAVTRQIDQLEHYYGAALIERGPRGIKLTREGEYLAQAVEATLRELDSVKARIAASKSVVSGTVKICAAESLIALFIAPVIEIFGKRHPGVAFEIDTGSAPHIAGQLTGGQVDVALAFYTPVSAEIQVTNSCQLEHKVLMSAHHPLAGKRQLTLKEIAKHPVATPPANYAVRQLLESAARREGLHFDMRFITSSMEVQKMLALQGQTLLILPQLNLNDSDGLERLIAVPLTDSLMGSVKVDLCLPRQRTLSMATRLFHELLAQRIEGQNTAAR